MTISDRYRELLARVSRPEKYKEDHEWLEFEDKVRSLADDLIEKHGDYIIPFLASILLIRLVEEREDTYGSDCTYVKQAIRGFNIAMGAIGDLADKLEELDEHIEHTKEKKPHGNPKAN